MKLLYVGKNLPFGPHEAFVIEELRDHLDHGVDVMLAPLTGGTVFHAAAKPLIKRTIHARLMSPRVLGAATRVFIRHPRRVFSIIADIMCESRMALLPRNLAVVAKGLWLGEKARQNGVTHIHAHWIAVPATMAMIAARVALIPFSVTAHRYDIDQDNLLPLKLASAAFVRAIDCRGANRIIASVPNASQPPIVLPMGIHVPALISGRRKGPLSELRLVMAARLIPVKGHVTLLHAIVRASKEGVPVVVDLFGEGQLESALRQLCADLEISGQVNFAGSIDHSTLLPALADTRYDAAVLPSRTQPRGEREGIPVFLMEAMAAGLPVITTPCGGISDLVTPECGVVVPEGDSQALAAAFLALARDGTRRLALAKEGRECVIARHDIRAVGQQLRALFGSSGDANVN